MAGQLSFNELFDPEFLTALELFTLRARRVSHGGFIANQTSPSLGSGLEFQDFKAYVPGDDIRAIDLNIYQRLGKLFIRLFEEQRNLPLYLLIDHSASMYFNGSERIIAGLRTALALSSVSLSQHDSVGIYTFTDRMSTLAKSRTGKHNLLPIARLLTEIQEGTTTGLSESLMAISQLKLRRGLLVIISDFFDPDVLDNFRQRLRNLRHRVILIQLFKNEDADPTLQEEIDGDVHLLDCETSAGLDVSIDAGTLNRYRTAYQNFNHALTDSASSSNAGLLAINAGEDVLTQLGELFQYPV